MNRLNVVALTFVIVLAVVSAVGLTSTEANAVQTTNIGSPAGFAPQALIAGSSPIAAQGSPALTSAFQWSRTCGGTYDDVANAAQQTSDGGYILAGWTNSFGADVAWLVKTDASGNVRWYRTFGVEADAFAVQQTQDGGYILAGNTYSIDTYSQNAYLVKTDASGNEQWNKTFGGSTWGRAYAARQTSDGYIVAGSTYSSGAGGYDAWLIKTDMTGNEQWNKTFGGSGYDGAYAVQKTKDGGYVLAGYTESFGAGSGDAWLIKTDANGNKLWDKTFGGSSADGAYAVQQTREGGYVLAGQTASPGAGVAWLIKTEANGNKLWDKTFAVSASASAVQQTRDGGYVLAGWGSSGATGYDALLIKTDAYGNRLWDKTYGGSNYDFAATVLQTRDGGYILAGYTNSFGAGSYDAWLVKTNSRGA